MQLKEELAQWQDDCRLSLHLYQQARARLTELEQRLQNQQPPTQQAQQPQPPAQQAQQPQPPAQQAQQPQPPAQQVDNDLYTHLLVPCRNGGAPHWYLYQGWINFETLVDLDAIPSSDGPHWITHVLRQNGNQQQQQQPQQSSQPRQP